MQEKQSRELLTTQCTLTRTAAELEEATRLADMLYETSNHLGAVVHYLLKELGLKLEDGGDPDSFELILHSVSDRLETQEVPQAIGSNESPSETNIVEDSSKSTELDPEV